VISSATSLEARRLLQLGLPLVLGQVAQTGVAFTDTVMVGRLGSAPLAGVALGGTVYVFLFILCAGVLFSVAPTVSQALGAGRREKAVSAARQGIWLALFLSVPVVVLLNLMGPLFTAMGQDPETTVIATLYLKIICWGFLPMLLTVALRGFLEGGSDTRPLMFILLLGLGVKILLNFLLMYGWGPVPALGVRGTAIASVGVYTVEFLAAALYVTLKYRSDRLLQGIGRPQGAMLRELAGVGVPIGLTIGFESGLFTATALLMGIIGQLELAAHQIALQSASFAFNIPLGLAVATSVRVGTAVGARDGAGASLAARTGIGLSVLVMSGTGLLFWLAPGPVIGLFIDRFDPANAGIVGFATMFLGLAAMFQIVDGLQVATSGALRGYRDTRVPMLISLVAYWLIGFSTGLILAFVFDLGGRGLWIGLVVGIAAASALLLWRFRWRSRQPIGLEWDR
jgi:MATE family multidrug resistance protein